MDTTQLSTHQEMKILLSVYYGEKARILYDNDLISEGHYEELLNKNSRW